MKAPVVKPKAKATEIRAAAKPAVAVKAVKAAPPPAKPAAKTTAKAATKPANKAPAKPVAQALVKAAVKPAAKPVAKVAPQAAVKPAVKAASKTPSVVTKAKSGKAVPSVAAAPATQPAPLMTKKKPEPVTTTVPTESVTKVVKSAKVAPVVESTPVAKPAPVPPPMTPLGVPVRSGRPSSRLAQLTVPSMAQSVASTAAKASFTQMTTTQPIVSPLASSVKRDPKLAGNWKKKPVAELTDAEVIAMSDNDYMNDTQMAFFRLKLVALKNDILSNAGETTEHLREDTVVVPDPADRATIEEEHALELRTRDRERKLLKKIEQSINRIDAGDYGYCDETGEPIGVGRLLARPTATLSLEAQQRRELKQKMFGD